MQFQRVQKNSVILSIRPPRAWNIECLQYEIREIIFPASIKRAMEMQAEAEHRKREEILQK